MYLFTCLVVLHTCYAGQGVINLLLLLRLLLLLHSLRKRLQVHQLVHSSAQVVPRKLTLPNDAVLHRPCRHDGFQVPRTLM